MIKVCHGCQEEVIPLLIEQCKYCPGSYCPSHFDHHQHQSLRSCKYCREELTESTTIDCSECGKVFCSKCAKACDLCSYDFCKSCGKHELATCVGCDLELCRGCKYQPKEIELPETEIYCEACWEQQYNLVLVK